VLLSHDLRVTAKVRPATIDDLETINDIYFHYVVNSHVTFDTEPAPMGSRVLWFNRYNNNERHRLLVADDGGRVIGYTYSGEFKDKGAYDPSVETSVYLDPAATGRGVGALLYEGLFNLLSGADVHRAYAGIALPNPASIALHERFDFRKVAHFTEVGRKLGQWWDVAWYERDLS
jgi:phosphinothricin acetyltransferase